MNRRSFFATICAAVAGAKAKVWKPADSRPVLTINRLAGFLPRMKIGDTITIRKPQRFVIQDGAANFNMDALDEMYLKPAVKSFADQMESELMVTYGYSPKFLTQESLKILNQSLIAGRYPMEPREPEKFFEPSGDIPLDDECECEDYEDYED